MTRKIKFVLLFSSLIILGLCTKSQARITTSDPTVESGSTATITINSQEGVANGSIDVTSSGGLTFVSASASNGVANGTKIAFAGMEDKKSGIATYKFKVPSVTKTTTYKVVFSSTDMENSAGESVASSSATATVTVKAKESSSGSGSSGNTSGSGSGSSSSGNSGGTNNTQAPSFTTVNETVYVTEDGINVRSSYSTSSKAIGTVNKGDKLTRIGVAKTSINGIKWSKIKYNGQTAYITSSYLSTEKPEESNEKNLKSLTIEGDYKLTPEFDKDVTEYSLSVGSDVESIKIDAKAVDSNAKVEITGNDKLLEGENTIEIKVTAEDGTVRTYKINVTKGKETVSSELGLSELSIEGYTLTPNFSTDVYEYRLDIEDETVTSLNINAKSFIDKTKIDIAGNNDLKLGENIITILVNSEDGKDVVTYQIIVNIKQKTQESNQIIAGINNKDLYMYAGIGLAVLLILIIIIVIIKHKNRDSEFEEYDGKVDLFNSMNNEKDNKDEIKRSVIEENFGENVTHNDFRDEETGRKKGKHF